MENKRWPKRREGHDNSMTPDSGAEAIQSAANPHFGGRLRCAESCGDFSEGPTLEKPEHDGITVSGFEFAQGFVEMRFDLICDGGGISKVIHGGKFEVPLLASEFGTQSPSSDKSRGLVEPAGQNDTG
jgi:hypothetical protein